MIKKVAAGVAAFGSASAVVLSLVVPDLVDFEGLRTKAYLDPVGIPTVCVGETAGVKMGDTYTKEECLIMLEARVEEFDKALGKCIKGEFPVEVVAAVLHWAYNVGTGAACSSTLAKKLNRGDISGACAELPKWKYATDRHGDKVVPPGIPVRREHEMALCMKGAARWEKSR